MKMFSITILENLRNWQSLGTEKNCEYQSVPGTSHIENLGYRWVPGTSQKILWVLMGTRYRPEKIFGYRWVQGSVQIFNDADPGRRPPPPQV